MGRGSSFTSSRSGNYHLYVKSLDPDTPEVEILGTERREFRTAGRPTARSCGTRRRTSARPCATSSSSGMDGTPLSPMPMLKKPNVWHDGGEFSPNGRYLAFSSTASGMWEAYVCRRRRSRQRSWQVSRELSWVGPAAAARRGGALTAGELYYVIGNDTVMAVEVETDGPAFAQKPAKRLFALAGIKGNFPDEMHWLQKSNVTGDGQRFVFVRKVAERQLRR